MIDCFLAYFFAIICLFLSGWLLYELGKKGEMNEKRT